MDPWTAPSPLESYRIDTPVYQGPMDLLLQLIENAELDITAISIAQVTDQYLKHLEKLADLPADEISSFLVLAAKLIQIKSESLLPQQSSAGDEENDLGNELARQLVAYKRYKQIADLLAERKEHGYQSFIRINPPPVDVKEVVDLAGFGLDDLFQLASTIFEKDLQRQSISTVVERPKITIREKISQISDLFRTTDSLSFKEIIGANPSRLGVVITFLALLELIKGDFVSVSQDKVFGDIRLVKRKEVDEMNNFSLKNLEL